MGINKPNNKQVNANTLLEKLDSRTLPDSKRSAASKEAVKKQWQQMVNQNKKKSLRNQVWAVAASFALVSVLAIFLLNDTNENNPIMIASVNHYSGEVMRNQPDGTWVKITSDEQLVSGVTIKTTTNSFMSLKLTDGSEIRVADNTEFSAFTDQIILKHGKIYHDTDDAKMATPLTIKTDQGLVQHIGTRYMVSQEDGHFQVAVRSGKVMYSNENISVNSQVLNNNEMIQLAPNQSMKLSTIEANDATWDWTFIAQPEFDLNNKSLHEFISWYAHQNGLSIDWNNFESLTKRVRLHGKVHNLSPDKAINTVFLSTQYGYSIDQGVLQINIK